MGAQSGKTDRQTPRRFRRSTGDGSRGASTGIESLVARWRISAALNSCDKGYNSGARSNFLSRCPSSRVVPVSEQDILGVQHVSGGLHRNITRKPGSYLHSREAGNRFPPPSNPLAKITLSPKVLGSHHRTQCRFHAKRLIHKRIQRALPLLHRTRAADQRLDH